ncbi:MAG: hypothetical protein IPI46_06885 [Bacteroidetes bacterium]|nr:hypothetical protein [Bacteroidota bacterium]
MKKLTLLVTCLFFANFAKSAILRCNNNPTVLGTYLTAQAAHDAAIAGDTIHLEPTNFGSYGNLSITKKIVLISTGNFLNQNPGIQANNSSGYCDRIDIISGGENSVISAKLNGRIFVEVSNVFISNTYCQDVQLGYNSGAQINNVIISKCFLHGNGVGMSSLCSDIIISNNYLNGIYIANPNSSATITYNVIENPGFTAISNSIISNNIFYSANPYVFPNSIVIE